MTIRLHPNTPHGDRLHRCVAVTSDSRGNQIGTTRCFVKFALVPPWKEVKKPLPRCETCWG